MTVTITKTTAIKIGLSSVKPARHVKVGPNRVHQTCIATCQHSNNLQGLAYAGRSKRYAS